MSEKVRNDTFRGAPPDPMNIPRTMRDAQFVEPPFFASASCL